jgi:hypothetical protein
VSLTPVNNLSAVSLTPAITFFPGVVDTTSNQNYLLLAASGASDEDVWGIYGYNLSWMAVPMTPSAAVAYFGGRGLLRRPEISLIYPLLLSPILGSSLVLVTDNKVIAGVVVTGDNCSPVTTTPVINLLPVSTTPAITENP